MVADTALMEGVRQEIDILRRHVTLLRTLEEHQPIGIIRLSKLLDYPQHKVRYTLRILEQEGLVRPSQEGAVTTEKANGFRNTLRTLLDEMGQTVESLRESL